MQALRTGPPLNNREREREKEREDEAIATERMVRVRSGQPVNAHSDESAAAAMLQASSTQRQTACSSSLSSEAGRGGQASERRRERERKREKALFPIYEYRLASRLLSCSISHISAVRPCARLSPLRPHSPLETRERARPRPHLDSALLEGAALLARAAATWVQRKQRAKDVE